MLGLVLWSDPKRRKALIWCEDQRDLAYFDGALEGAGAAQSGGGDTQDGPNVGDMLAFDICHSGHLKRATNVRTLYQRAAEDLVELLRPTVGAAVIPEATMPGIGARVLNFPCERRQSEEPEVLAGLGQDRHV